MHGEETIGRSVTVELAGDFKIFHKCKMSGRALVPAGKEREREGERGTRAINRGLET